MAWANQGEGSDSSLFDDFLKDWYMSKWIDLVNNLTTTYKLFRRRVVPFRGRKMVLALRTGRSGAVGAIAPSGLNTSASGAPTTITPGYQPTDTAFVKPKLIMCGIAVPQDTMDVSQGDRAAFYDVVDFEMMGIKTDTANFLDLMCYRGGTNLATVGVDVGGGVWEVDNFYGFDKGKRIEFWITGFTNTKRTHPATGWFDVTTKGRNSVDGAHEITTATDDASVIATDLIFNAGARGSDASNTNLVGLEFLGLDQIVSDANLDLYNMDGNQNYLSLDRTTFFEWKSTKIDAGGALSFDLMQQTLDRIHDESGGEPSVILTHRDTRRAYAKKCQFNSTSSEAASNVRFNDSVRTQGGVVSYSEDSHYGGGSDYMMFDNRLPIIVDRYATHDFTTGAEKGTMYFLDTRHFYYALVTDWKWWAPEGRILREAHATSNNFGVQAHAYMFGELVCDAPNTCGVLHNITI